MRTLITLALLGLLAACDMPAPTNTSRGGGSSGGGTDIVNVNPPAPGSNQDLVPDGNVTPAVDPPGPGNGGEIRDGKPTLEEGEEIIQEDSSTPPTIRG